MSKVETIVNIFTNFSRRRSSEKRTVRSKTPVSHSCNSLVVEAFEERIMLSTVDVFAAGATGQENMQLLVDGVVVETFQSVKGDFEQRDFIQFTWETNDTITAGQLGVRFTNDLSDPSAGLDRNLYVDRVVVDGRIYESENSLTYVSSYWSGNGLTSGRLAVEELNVSGQFRYSPFGENTLPVTTVSVNAFGSTGEERFQILIDGQVAKGFFVSTTPTWYEVSLNRKVEFDQIRVRFINDTYDELSGKDRNLTVYSVEVLDLETSEIELRSPLQYGVLSTGTWLPDEGIVTGFGRGNVLHTNGFFEFRNGEIRSFDGTRNNTSTVLFDAGSAGDWLNRKNGLSHYSGDGSGSEMISEQDRPNARDISNALAGGSSDLPNEEGLSDFTWLWGQFLDHDLSLSTHLDGAVTNGFGEISINDPNDPLGPNNLRFTRSDYVVDSEGKRQQFNTLTSFIDASNVYGSSKERSDALRSFRNGKLKLDGDGLMPRNRDGLFNDDGGRPNSDLFFAGDARANEHVALTAIHTMFVREHNRLAGVIRAQNPYFNDEQIFQLARKIVGAQMQIITYNEFLPAVLGDIAPASDAYSYDESIDPAILNSFAHAAYRFGHTMLPTDLNMIDTAANAAGSISLRNAFFNPNFIREDAGRIDQLIGGAVEQRAQNIDNVLVEDVRNFLFGPPGAGGLDLAALNIQRGRDHGLPDYNTLREAFGLSRVTSFDQITSDVVLQQRLASVYGGDIDNIDPWVGGLAEDKFGNSAVGELFGTIITTQFTNLRDGDRLFYRSDVAGLYRDDILRDDIRNIINLDDFTVADVISNNTKYNPSQDVFYAPAEKAFVAVTVSGDTGAERFRVIVNSQIQGTFRASTSAQRYTFSVPTEFVAGDAVQIQYLNDRHVGSVDRNLNVSSIEVAGLSVDPSSQSVFSTGTWRAEDGVVPGFGRGNSLNVNGFFEYSV